MGNLEMGLELDLDLELELNLNLELSLKLEFFSMQTYHLYGTAPAVAAVLEACILSGALSHRRTLLLSEVVYWQSSSCLNP